MPDPTQPPSSPGARASRLTTYLVTNGTKVAGVYLILKEAGNETTRDSVLLVGAALALGAQAMEDIILRVIDRFFGDDGSR